MNEKKLTDEEIVKALENTRITLDELKEDDDDYEKLLLIKKITNCSLDLIRRLQDEKKELQESADLFSDFNGKLNAIIAEQKAEIERLKEEKAFYKEKSSTLSEDYESLKKDTDRLEFRLSDERVKNAELQKQVDELKGKICELVADKGNLVVKVKQTVKDTAKEILTELIEKAHSNGCIDLTVNEVKAWFREDYGVEVE